MSILCFSINVIVGPTLFELVISALIFCNILCQIRITVEWLYNESNNNNYCNHGKYYRYSVVLWSENEKLCSNRYYNNSSNVCNVRMKFFKYAYDEKKFW